MEAVLQFEHIKEKSTWVGAFFGAALWCSSYSLEAPRSFEDQLFSQFEADFCPSARSAR